MGMETYLVFLREVRTGEDFVAPATAETHEEALLAVGEKYPPRLYKLHTYYKLAEIERIVADVKRWPGVASRIQPTLEQLTKRVVAGGSVPPLFQAPVAEISPSATPAPVVEPQPEPVTIVEALKELPAAPEAAEVEVRREIQTVEEAPEAEAQAEPEPQPVQKPVLRTMAATIIKKSPAQSSALDVLKTLRS